MAGTPSRPSLIRTFCEEYVQRVLRATGCGIESVRVRSRWLNAISVDLPSNGVAVNNLLTLNRKRDVDGDANETPLPFIKEITPVQSYQKMKPIETDSEDISASLRERRRQEEQHKRETTGTMILSYGGSYGQITMLNVHLGACKAIQRNRSQSGHTGFWIYVESRMLSTRTYHCIAKFHRS